MFPMKHVMAVTYFVVAASIPLLLAVHPSGSPIPFALIFGFAMGADYMLIPLMAAKQFGVNSLARAMAIILPVNTIGQTWIPQGVSWMRESFGNYSWPMAVVLGIAVLGAIAIVLLPRQGAEEDLALSPAGQTAAVR
jgi:MFS family permease